MRPSIRLWLLLIPLLVVGIWTLWRLAPEWAVASFAASPTAVDTGAGSAEPSRSAQRDAERGVAAMESAAGADASSGHPPTEPGDPAAQEAAARAARAEQALARSRAMADVRTQRTRELLQPMLRATSFGELNQALDSLPMADRESARLQFNSVRQWCSSVQSPYFDRDEFIRATPLRYAAIVELRTFCMDASASSPSDTTTEPPIFPLGSALLGAVSQQFMGDFSARRSAGERAELLRRASNIFEVAMALTQYYRSGARQAPAALGCEAGCASAFWPASMIMACATLGGCSYRTPLVLGFCATGFLAEGCRVGADYATAIRDRYPHADWRRIEWAIGQIAADLAPST